MTSNLLLLYVCLSPASVPPTCCDPLRIEIQNDKVLLAIIFITQVVLIELVTNLAFWLFVLQQKMTKDVSGEI